MFDGGYNLAQSFLRRNRSAMALRRSLRLRPKPDTKQGKDESFSSIDDTAQLAGSSLLLADGFAQTQPAPLSVGSSAVVPGADVALASAPSSGMLPGLEPPVTPPEDLSRPQEPSPGAAQKPFESLAKPAAISVAAEPLATTPPSSQGSATTSELSPPVAFSSASITPPSASAAAANTISCCGSCGYINCPTRPLEQTSSNVLSWSGQLPGMNGTIGPDFLPQNRTIGPISGAQDSNGVSILLQEVSFLSNGQLPGGGEIGNSLASSPGVKNSLSGPVTSAAARPAGTQSLATQNTAAAASATNLIVLENQKQGNPESEWGIDGPASTNIEGFATDISVNHGNTISFKINTDSTNYRIDIYRLGYYGGLGARKVQTLQHTGLQSQPAPLVDKTTGEVDAGNWSVSASWNVPADAVSGVYIAKLVRQDGTSGQNEIPFIVRDDASRSDIIFQTADQTWQAYNPWGGANFYGGNGPATGQGAGRAYAVSYNRPITTRDGGLAAGPQDYIFGAEYPAISWLEQNGYDVSYMSGVDVDRYGSLLLNHKMYLDVGHDEYWSGQQRTNVEAARDAGVNLSFWSGNEVYWRTRWGNSLSADATPYRSLISYKETWAPGSIDPSNEWTGTFRDPRNSPPAIGGGQPENALTGTIFQVDSYRLDAITVPYEDSDQRFWRNTSVASLQPGQTATLTQNYLGYEWDEAPDNGFDPAGLVKLSSTTLDVQQYLLDYGNTVGDGTATHNLTLYRAPSGALVFGAGTVYWSWGLSANHDNEATPADPRVQQAMVNLFADMGIQPATLQSGLIAGTASTDRTAPTSAITSPNSGSSITAGQVLTISGTAADAGGGVVAGVEVSTDNGASWHPATGDETWTYRWSPQVAGSYTIKTRAVDDSVNLETPGAGRTITVTQPSYVTLFPGNATPATVNTADTDAVELGVKFQASSAGTVSGIRFYKGTQDTGTHTGTLWTSTGTKMATATFSNETTSGWQTVTFASPVTVTAGTTYVASYHTNVGHYSSSTDYFANTYTNGPLTAPSSATAGGNGVFTYGATSQFPTNTFQATNFWVDVLFNQGATTVNQPPVANNDTGPTVTRDTALSITTASLLANDTDPSGDTLTVTGVSAPTNGTAVLNAAATAITFTPAAGYTGPAGFTYTIADGRGGTASAAVSLTVAAPGSTPVGLFADTVTPTTVNTADTSAVELGMKFQASAAGTISGIQFYKGTQDTGTHTGALWSSTGTKLATATFSNETASGWQTVTFSNPVSVTAGTTYIASYHTNTGHYSSSPNFFANALTNGPLTAPSSATAGGNGVYTYGTTSQFPTSSFQATNYYVDVLFNQGATTVNQPPVATNDTGPTVTRDTALSITTASLLANDSDPNGDTLTVTGVSAPTNGTVSLNAAATAITFTPTTGYTGPAGFTYAIADGRGGTASAAVSLTVAAPGSTPVGLFADTVTPTTVNTADTSAVELGMKFQASAAGTISGIQFYKGSQDTGTHTGALWSSTGTKLATATFSNETASGWQTVTFANPVSVTAGTTYIASYHTDVGRYSSSPNFFTNALTSGPLTAPSSATAGGNGVYSYGASQFPTNSFQATNYYVDVLFNQGATTVNQPPVATNDTGPTVTRNTALSITTASLLANDSDPNGDTLTVTGVSAPTNGTVSLNAAATAITFTPTTGYTGPAGFTYAIADGRGGTASAAVSLTVAATAPTPVGLFADSVTPTTVNAADTSAVELGMKFQASTAGTISGIQFYKGSQDTGTHTGALWSSTGTQLATATFSNETASGWQTVTFANPVAVTAGTTYIASYHTNVGRYSSSPNFFANALTNGPLTAPSSATAGGNGVYSYGTTSQFPTNSFQATNYYVDVLFNAQTGA